MENYDATDVVNINQLSDTMEPEQIQRLFKIPPQLQNDDYRFTKMEGKKPFPNNWQDGLKYDNQELWGHIANGGNYGVIAIPRVLTILDADGKDNAEYFKKALPKTFTVKSGGADYKRHFYLQVTGVGKNDTFDKKFFNGAHTDLQYDRKCVAGPGSLHPSGKYYKVVNNAKIAKISFKRLKYIIENFYNPKIKVDSIIDLSKFTRSGDEYQGPHPVHGSTTGKNFSINTKKNTWYCHRCNKGGDALTLKAMVDNNLPCDGVNTSDVYREYSQKIVELPIHIRVGNEIMDTHNIITDSMTGRTYIYKDGVYYNGEVAKNQLRKATIERLEEKMTSGRTDNSIDYIKGISQRKIKFDRNYICLEDCIMNTDTFETREQTPGIVLKNRIRTKLDKSKEYEGWNDFLLEMVVEQKFVDTIQEFIGYCLVPGQTAKKLLYIWGPKNSGKTTFANIISWFFGRKYNVSSLSLMQIMGKFTLQEIEDKIINIGGDIEYSLSYKRGAVIKQLTGGDEILVDRKFAPEMTKLRNDAKMIFTGNGVPNISNNLISDPAFLSRFLPVQFPNKFKKKKGVEEKWMSDNSRSIILNWAIDGLKRLRENDWEFTYNPPIMEIKDWFHKGLVPTEIESFLLEHCKPSKDGYIPKMDLYVKYKEVQHLRGLKSVHINKFGRNVSENRYFDVERHRHTEEDGTRTECWSGMEWFEL